MKKILFFFLVLLSVSQLRCAPDIIWGNPVPLSSSGVDSTDPKIVMDSNGNAVAAWLESGVVMASSYDQSGMTWGSAQTLSGSSSSAPRLGVDGGGNVTAIWLDSTGVVTEATLPFGGSWSSTTAVSAAGAVTPKLVVDNTGNAIVVWGRGGFIEVSTKLFAGSWSLPSMVSGANSDNPDISISNFGNAIIVWHTVVGGVQDQILSSTANIGGGWGSAKTVIAGTFKNNYPKVILDPSGNALAIWYRYVFITDYTNVFVATSVLSQGGVAWTPAVFLSSIGMGNPAEFTSRLRCDPFGNVIALWTISHDGITFDIESAIHQNGQAFTAANTIASSIYSYEADAAVNAFSDAVIGFMFYDGMNSIIQATETLLTGAVINSFTSPVNLTMGTNNGFPRVASIVSGNTIYAAAAWISFDGMNNIITVSNGSRVGVEPPTNLAVMQSQNDLGVFTEYFNTLTWDASMDPNLNQYGIFRNGIFIRIVGPEVTEFIDNNSVQNGAVTYGVSAITNDGSQSSIATVSFP